MNSIVHGLRGLLRFSGRDQPGVFWPYAIASVVVVMLVMAAIVVPTVIGAFAAVETFAKEHPDQVTVTTTPTSRTITVHGDHPELMPDLSVMTHGLVAAATVAVVLLAAAVTRRLHDTGRPGFLGLLPLPFIVIGAVGFPHLLGSIHEGEAFNMGLFFGLFANNIAYLGSLALLIVLLTRPGTDGANRYGERPA